TGPPPRPPAPTPAGRRGSPPARSTVTGPPCSACTPAPTHSPPCTPGSGSSRILEVEQRVGQPVAGLLQFVPVAIGQGRVDGLDQPLQLGLVFRRRLALEALGLLQQRPRLHRLAVAARAGAGCQLGHRRRLKGFILVGVTLLVTVQVVLVGLPKL